MANVKHCFEPAEYPTTALIPGLPLFQCDLWFNWYARSLGMTYPAPCWFIPYMPECKNYWPRFTGCLETLRAKLALGWRITYYTPAHIFRTLDIVEVEMAPPDHHGRCS